VDSAWEQEKLEASLPKVADRPGKNACKWRTPRSGSPQRPVHALLGNHEPARTLAIKKAQSLTDKLAP